jgi:amidase
MTEHHWQSASSLAPAIRRKEISSRELLELHLGRIKVLNGQINAVVMLDVERARQRAGELDVATARGESKGPLHGIPITIKDSYETAGLKTTCGAPIWRDHVPATNADAVQRLVDAGAVIVGKTNTPIFAGDVQSFNELFGTTNNPWDVSRTPGGSSGGAAAAVAAGMTPFELGSDIGGSIRTPAHFCGIYGHKPSYGLIPLRGHIPGPPGTLAAGDLSVAGPLTRNANDLGFLLDILAGPDEQQRTAWRLEIPSPRHTKLQDFRVAVWLDELDCPIENSMRSALESTAEALRKAGVKVDDKPKLPFKLTDAYQTYLRLLWPLMFAGTPDDTFNQHVARAATFAQDDRSLMASFHRQATARHRDWLRANEARARYRAVMATFFKQYDVLLMPVTPTPAFTHDHSPNMLERVIAVNGQPRPYFDNFFWISLATLCYLPATVAPIGQSQSLPVGLQIVGPYLEDRTTIRFAALIEEICGGFKAPPLKS